MLQNIRFYIFSILLIGITISTGCNDSGIDKFDEFSAIYNLTGTEVNDGIALSMGQIDIFDSLLIVTGTQKNLNCIHFFNKNSLEYISSTGARGNGPGEISNPAYCAIDKNKGEIWYRDYGKKCIWRFSIKEALNKENYLPGYSIPMPEENFFIFFKFENDSLFSFGNMDQNKLISFFDHNGKVIDSLTIPNTINFYKSEIPEFTRMVNTIYFYEKDEFNQNYIFAYRYSNLLAKISIDKRRKTELKIDNNEWADLPDNSNKYRAVANDCLKLNHSKIYCLYSGKPQMNKEVINFQMNYPQTINVYDSNLNSLAQFQLDHSAIWFEIDRDNNRIVTYSPDTGGLVFYNMPKNLINKLK